MSEALNARHQAALAAYVKAAIDRDYICRRPAYFLAKTRGEEVSSLLEQPLMTPKIKSNKESLKKKKMKYGNPLPYGASGVRTRKAHVIIFRRRGGNIEKMARRPASPAPTRQSIFAAPEEKWPLFLVMAGRGGVIAAGSKKRPRERSPEMRRASAKCVSSAVKLSSTAGSEEKVTTLAIYEGSVMRICGRMCRKYRETNQPISRRRLVHTQRRVAENNDPRKAAARNDVKLISGVTW